jgi:LDH2 family malate/lactate/ureidoglycolate dehydrogenase
LSKSSQLVSAYSGMSVKTFKSVADGLNLNRQQAAEFGNTLAQATLKGIHGADRFIAVANNLKDNLGKVDMAALKEAS